MSNTEKKNLLAIDDLVDDLDDIINWAIRYKNDVSIHQDFKPLDGMSIGSIYEKPSTRTRVSFEVGVSRLGGQPLTLLANDIQLGKSESIGDTAAVLSSFLDGSPNKLPILLGSDLKYHMCATGTTKLM